jgi:alcohol dehydrogenase (cytochrome c)
MAWEWRYKHPIVASVLSTSAAWCSSARRTAVHRPRRPHRRQLWEFRTGTGIHSSPISYSVAAANISPCPPDGGGWIKGFAPGLFGHERGSALFVFALPQDAAASAR